jgi:hypothetical protein
MGVTRVCVCNRSAKFREKTRTKKALVPQGPELAHRMRSTHQLVKRRHGLTHCRYKTEVGMQRWVGLGVISDISYIERTMRSTNSSVKTYPQGTPRLAAMRRDALLNGISMRFTSGK